MTSQLVSGDVDEGWGGVADAFLTNFEHCGEVGAACAVYHRGRAVVDLWGGIADAKTGRRWQADTIACLNSATKGITALCALLLAQDGLVDLDAPIAKVWPEFAAQGKDAITLRMVLAHRAGLARIDGLGPDQTSDREAVLAALAAQAPNWPPGTAQGYHATTMGWITDEVVRRVCGRSIGRYFADGIAGPLGLDLWIGLPETEEARFAPFVEFDPQLRSGLETAMTSDTLAAQVLGATRFWELDRLANGRHFHELELPFANGIGTAQSLAYLYAATHHDIDGHSRLLAEDTITDLLIPRSTPDDPDLVTGYPRRYGTGFLITPSLWADTGLHAYGHDGAGGALGMADPDLELGFGYIPNRLILTDQPYQRAATLLAATYQAVNDDL